MLSDVWFVFLGYGWVHDLARSGQNIDEALPTPSSVNYTNFGLLANVTLDGPVELAMAAALLPARRAAAINLTDALRAPNECARWSEVTSRSLQSEQ